MVIAPPGRGPKNSCWRAWRGVHDAGHALLIQQRILTYPIERTSSAALCIISCITLSGQVSI